MKVLIIIVALVAASFVLLMAYSAGRDEPAPGEQSGIAPPTDRDKLEDEGWTPPFVTNRTTGLQARFVKGLKVKPSPITINPTRDEVRFVPRSDERMRAVKLVLIEGDRAIVTAPDDLRACLCRVGFPIDEFFFGVCGKAWLSEQKGKVCQPGYDKGILGFDKAGGAMVLVRGPSATVEVVE